MKSYEDTKLYLKEYAEQNLTRSKKGFYCCPACGSGTRRSFTSDGALSIAANGLTWKCFSCEAGGDLADLIQINENLTAAEARKRALEFSGQGDTYKARATTKPVKKEVVEPTINFTRFIELCQKNINKTDYPQRRGLSEETIAKYKLGYYDGQGEAKEAIKKLLGRDIIAPALIIPYNRNCSYFIARATLETEAERAKAAEKGIGKANFTGKQKHDKPASEKAGREPIYNPAALYNEKGKPVFITEAPLDCLSFLEIGKEAIAIGGTGHNKLIEQLKRKPTKNALIIALDKDEPGQRAAEDLERKLKELGYKPHRI